MSDKLLKVALQFQKKCAQEENDTPPPVSWPELKEQGINNPWEISDKNNIRIIKNLERMFQEQVTRLSKSLQESEYLKNFSSEEKFRIRESLGKVFQELVHQCDVINDMMWEEIE